eukprot:snap_masked-scaffold_22-processed-gene-4.15-mRNA-1 protein AED:0.00 eAED:0.00 QI:0/-1/0/1/-1/1/1/0/291
MSDLDSSKYINQWVEIPTAYSQRDLLLYAVSIGCKDLRYIYEHHDDFAMFPSFPLTLVFKGTSHDVVSFPSPSMQSMPQVPLAGVKVTLDGERFIEKLGDFNPEGGDVTIKYRTTGVFKKGSGASTESEQLLVQDGKPVFRILSGAFSVGAKGFTDAGTSFVKKIVPPKRNPDISVNVATTETQANLYRLAGDYNPLHIDPEFAKISGFKAPILHGLCSYGVTLNAALEAVGADPKDFKSFRGRFAKPVMPGDTLTVELWKEGAAYIVQVKVGDAVVINNGMLELQPKGKL